MGTDPVQLGTERAPSADVHASDAGPKPTNYLVVANQTLGGQRLLDMVHERHMAGPAVFRVLVPATPTMDDVLGAGALYGGVFGAEGLAMPVEMDDAATSQERAEERLAATLDRFRALGIHATGEVGDPDPVEAIAAVLEREEIDEILLSTLPPGISRWLKLDLVCRARRRFDVPVTHVYVDEPATA